MQIPYSFHNLQRCWLQVLTGVLLGSLPIKAEDVALPEGVKAVWNLEKTQHQTTPTREQFSLNGLWRWQPAQNASQDVSGENWGYFKVPGSWPGITDYMQKDSQVIFSHPAWENQKTSDLTAAWYEREFSVPNSWNGRRIALKLEYLNSFASVLIDGKKAGEIQFPGGELDITSFCTPGQTHHLRLLVVALPLKGVMLSYTDSASAREVKGSVARRGLCGDVSLVSSPAGPSITETAVETSVRKKEVTLTASFKNLDQTASYKLKSSIFRKGSLVKEFISAKFQAADLKDAKFSSTWKWIPRDLWDLNQSQNLFDLQVSLLDANNIPLDTAWQQPFGFREFWIDGRDFYLNGTPLHLSAVPLDNAQIGAALATYSAAKETFERLQSFGINYVYTHNYGCEPGAHLSFKEILQAADDTGMLVGLTQPHFSHYEWKNADADATNGYSRHAAYYAAIAGNHPSVVMYVMSHNSTGYEEDMNPQMIDGIRDGRDQWSSKNVQLATRAEAIVRNLDPGRIVYHHASGNLGVMHDMNFYPNFAPIQELDDWFEHWAKEGVKPVFTCEYGAPFTWDWTMYRGWYKGQREWGSAKVPWEFCLAEWNAQFFGDRAYQISDFEKTNLRWEAAQVRAGKVWNRWDYPNPVGSDRFEECYPVFAMYLTDNWRAYRTFGVSGISPWEYGHFWKLRPGVNRKRTELKVDWDQLQRPGFSPDFIDQQFERMDVAFERSDWVPTVAAQALIRNNRSLLAYIAGKPTAFTSKDHNFIPGETIEKQIIVINNSREQITADLQWSTTFPKSAGKKEKATVPAGSQVRFPLKVNLPKSTAPGSYELLLSIKFSTGESQQDRFALDVQSLPPTPETIKSKIAMFDPAGETTRLLHSIGCTFDPVDSFANLSGYDLLIIGKAALSLEGNAPDIRRVRDGLKVIVFEQTSEVLEQRLGFRVEEYGLRQLFPRIPDHPVLDGIHPNNLRDWRGSATILPEQLKYQMRPRYGPTVEWAGLPQTRVWRAGNRGNVASVLIEKPARGNFLPVLDGGFSLRFSPLLEFREGKGMVLFCQLDVTGRTENDPSAEALVRNMIQYISKAEPAPSRAAVYAGEPDGKSFLDSLGIQTTPPGSRELSLNETLILGPGAKLDLIGPANAVSNFLTRGGHLIAIGLDRQDLAPLKITLKTGEHIASFFPPFALHSPFVGVGPADVHNRDPRNMSLVSAGAEIYGDGVLASLQDSNALFIQMAPWKVHSPQQPNRRTFRHSSFMLNRALANMGVSGNTPLLERFSQPVKNSKEEKRYLQGFYLDQPEEWDDPYRFFRW